MLYADLESLHRQLEEAFASVKCRNDSSQDRPREIRGISILIRGK